MEIKKEHAIETYKSLINISVAGMKMLMILNGGATVALLAYLGNVTGKGQTAPDMRLPMGFFIGGLVFCSLTMFCSYLTQLRLYQESVGLSTGSKSLGHKFWLNFGIISALLSIVAFAIGSFLAVVRFTYS